MTKVEPGDILTRLQKENEQLRKENVSLRDEISTEREMYELYFKNAFLSASKDLVDHIKWVTSSKKLELNSDETIYTIAVAISPEPK